MIRSNHRAHTETGNAALLIQHGRRLLQFSAVGTIGVVVNLALFGILTRIYSINGVAAVALATEGAIVSNFALNDRWTFRLHRGTASWPRRALAYNLVCTGGLVISMSVFALCARGARLPDLFANVIAIGAGTLWNYAANVRLTWGGGYSIRSSLARPSHRVLSIRRPSAHERDLPVGVPVPHRSKQSSPAQATNLPLAAPSAATVVVDDRCDGMPSAGMPPSPKEISRCSR